MAVEVAP